MNKEEYIFGIHAVIEAIDAGKELDKVLIRTSRGTSDMMGDLRQRLTEAMIPIQYVPVEKLNSITKKNHQGVIAFLSEIQYSEIDFILPRVFEQGRVPLILVLDGISDVRNFGAIARTAECAGVDAIILPFKGSARITAEAIKTSAGALHSIPVCRHPDLVKAVRYLKDSGLKVFTASEKTNELVYSADLTLPTVIILGAEDTGVSERLKGLSDHSVAIPLSGKIRSLNVSVAAGILLFEAVRQRS
ncbi:23S rRNA (guanosine(2251)-2'-O)-methyltransferase RlmB [Bacteroidota bacterium]